MKRKITLSVALVLSVALLLMTFDSATRAQPPERFVADTGVVKLGPNQILRITIGPDIRDRIIVRFEQTSYTQNGCNADGVCKLTGTNTLTGPITLMPGEAASYDILAAGTYGRGIVVTNNRNAHVNASIIDMTTGQVDAVLIALLVT